MAKITEWGRKTMESDDARWRARKITDFGKLRALREAGWTVRKIAREFIVTDTEVKRAMKQEGIL